MTEFPYWKATKLIKQFKMLSNDAKQVKHYLSRLDEFSYDVDHFYKEIKSYKTGLNELIYVMQFELDGIKASLDGILEDTDSKDCDGWMDRLYEDLMKITLEE